MHKLIVLDILQNTKTPLSLSDIHSRMHVAIADRTLRRALQQLQQEQLVQFLGHNKNRQYQAIIKQVPYVENMFSAASENIINQLRVPLYDREPCTYNRHWLDSYIPNQTFYFTPSQLEMLHEYGGQTIEEQPAGTYAHNIYERLLIDLSYNSSRLEGNTYSISDTKQLLLYGQAAIGKLDSEKVMILNHKEAIRYLVDNIQNMNINEDNIRTLHYLLSDGLVVPDYSGHIRHEGVKVSGSVYIPIDNRELIHSLFKIIIDKAFLIQEPFEQSIFLLVHLSYLQAFIDVNKRLARLAANIPLIKHNLVPLAFNEIDVGAYRTAIIAIYEFNQVAPLVDLYIWSYIRTCKQYKVTAEAMGFDAFRVKYRVQRRNLLRDIIKNQITSNILSYVQEETQKKIPEADAKKFINDFMQELSRIDVTNVAGLGITKQELQQWQDQAMLNTQPR